MESVLFLQIFLRFLPRPKYQKSELVHVEAAVLDGSYQQSLWLRSVWLRGRRAIPMEIRRFSRKEGVDGFFEPECVAA